MILKCADASATNSGEPAEIISPMILSAKKKPITEQSAKNKNDTVKKVLYSLLTNSSGFESKSGISLESCRSSFF